MYDIVTYFPSPLAAIRRRTRGLLVLACVTDRPFEEMKLFLASSSQYSSANGNRVPFPDRKHLGTWWNVWDVDDIISYSVKDIVEGVDETQFRVGQVLLKEHVGYLQEVSFYQLFAEKVRQASIAS